MKIAVYSRKSKFTGKGESIENQVLLCREYIRRCIPCAVDEDITVYEDEGFSAKNFDRPQFSLMMKSARAQPFDYIVVYRLDRISRNVGDFARLIEELNGMNTAFVCIKEQFDTSTPMGRAMMNIAAVFAQLERETIAERVRDNLVLLARTGRWLGGVAPLGFVGERVEVKDGSGKSRTAYKLSVVADEMRTVRAIYSRFAELRSLSGTAAWCIQNGLTTRGGGDFRTRAVRDILTNPVYCTADESAFDYFARLGSDVCFERREADGKRGIMPFCRTAQSGSRARRLPADEWLIALGKHRGIIPSADWIHTQQIIGANAGRSFYRPARSGAAVFSGLVRCGKCGSVMRPRINSRAEITDGTRRFSYMCEGKERSRRASCDMDNVNGNALDSALSEGILGYFLGDIALRADIVLRRCECRADVCRDRRTELEKIISDSRRGISNLMNALAKSESAALTGYIKAETERLDAELHSAEAELAALSEERSAQSDVIPLAERLGDVRRVFAELSAEKRRGVMLRIVERVVWDGACAHVYFRSGAE